MEFIVIGEILKHVQIQAKLIILQLLPQICKPGFGSVTVGEGVRDD
jgi:hypothetical protein